MQKSAEPLLATAALTRRNRRLRGRCGMVSASHTLHSKTQLAGNVRFSQTASRQLLTPVVHRLLSPAHAVGDQQGGGERGEARLGEGNKKKRHIIIDAAVKSLFVGGPLI